MTRPRRDVILRRFLAGESTTDIAFHYWKSGIVRSDVEQAIRDALNRKRSKAMKLDDKRKVIEVLLCAGPPPRPGCSETSASLGHGRDAAWTAIELWGKAFISHDGTYPEIAAEAAYRLIESSPTLRREWFGAR